MGYPESQVVCLGMTPPDSYFRDKRVKISAVNVMIYMPLSISATFRSLLHGICNSIFSQSVCSLFI